MCWCAIWDGNIADIDLYGGADIDAALADADLILVDDGAAGTNRKSAVSRIWTYITGKIQGLAAKTVPLNSDILMIQDTADSNNLKKLTISNLFSKRFSLGEGVTEKSVAITSSSNQLDLTPLTANINHHTLTENTELQVPSMAAWAAGTVVRMDLFVKVDASATYTFSLNSSWTAAGGTLPTPSTDANAVDWYVITLHKDLGLAVIGQAAKDIS